MLKVLGAWTPDQPDTASGVTDAVNVIPYSEHYGPFPGPVVISGVAPAQPVGAISTSVINATSETFIGTATKIYQYLSNAWTDRSGAVYAASVPPRWAFVQFKNYVLGFSFANLAQQKLIGSVSNFAAITDSPKARVAGVVRNFIFAGDIDDPTDGQVPYRVRWNAIAAPLSWPLPGSGAAVAAQADQNDLRAEHGSVMAIFGTDVGIILQERAITRAEYVGSPVIFRFDTMETTHGLVARDAAAQVGRVVYYLSESGFFRNDGAGESTPIGHAQVDKWFYANVNPSALADVRALHDSYNRIVIWTFASLGSATPDMVLIYNYRDQKWARGTLATSLLITARTAGYTIDNIDGFGTLDTINEGLDSAFWLGGLTLPAVFDDQYRLVSLSGDALTATIETGELLLDGRRGYISGVRPLVEGGDAQISMGTRKLVKDPVVWNGPRSITPATGIVDFRSSAHFQRARVTIPSGFTKAYAIDALVNVDDGQR